MSQSVGVDLNLDASQYAQAAGMAMASTTGLEQALGRLAVQAGAANRALSAATPSPTHIAGFAGFAAAAMASQQSLSSLNATQAIAGQSAQKLGNTIRSMARDMPIGQRAAQQIVETVNQLGVSGAGTEGKIAKLSKTVAMLQGATGEFGPALAQGLTNLDRAFGNRSLDPKRVQATADSLTTVSKTAGAGAQSILDFSNSIAPMAKQAGIGESATLGIASAFAQIGQDGTAATSAVTKMLTDMNRAVRDGTGDMNIYANAVGMTRQNFEQLFKANPAGALTQVTQALSSGPQGQRTLDALGLDGVRTQRSLLAVSQGGNLQNFIDQAVGARGSGSTAKGAQAAWNTTADEFQKLGTAAGQVAVALGTPLLTPLKLFAETLSTVLKPAAGFLGDRHGVSALTSGALGVGGGLLLNRALGGRLGMGTAATVGGLGGLALGGATGSDGIASGAMSGLIGLMLARRVFGVGLGVQTARQVSTAGLFGAARAGYARGRGQEPTTDAKGRVNFGFPFGRTAGYMDTAQQEGRLTSEAGMVPGIWGRVYGFAHGAGQAMGEGGGSFGGGIRGLARGIGQGTLWAGSAYARVLQASSQFGSEPDPTKRGAIWDRAMRRSGISGVVPEDIAARAKTGPLGPRDLRVLEEQIRNTAKEFGTLGNVVRSTGGAFSAAARGLAGGIGKVGQGIGSSIGWGNIALMVGFAGVTSMMGRKSKADAARTDFQQSVMDEGPSGTMNKYLESIGRAADATHTFASTAELSATTLAGTVKNMNQALAPLSSSELQVANATRGQVVSNFGNASPQSVAAQIQLMQGGTSDPSSMEAIKLDLARQYNPNQVNDILAQLQKPAPFSFSKNPTPAGQPMGVAAGFNAPALQQAAHDITNAPADYPYAPDSNQVREQDYYGPGTGTLPIKPNLKGYTRDEMKRMVQGVETLRGQQAGLYGDKYASQEQFQEVNQVMNQMARSNNEAATNETGDALARAMGFKGTIPRITSSDIRKYGGYVQALMAKSKDFKQTVQALGPGIQINPGGPGGLAPTAQHGGVYTQAQKGGVGGTELSLLDNTQTTRPMGFNGPVAILPTGTVGPQAPGMAAQNTPSMQEARGAVQAYLAQPGDTQKQDTAVSSSVAAMEKAGMSLNDVVASATKVAGAFDDTASAAYQLAQAQIAYAQEMRQAKAPFQTSGQNSMAQLKEGITLSQTKGQNGAAARAQGRQEIEQANADIENSLKQRIEMWYQYNTAAGRAQEDFTRQQSRANEAFQRQQGDAFSDYLRQRGYMQEDYQRQVSRAQEDFRIQQGRAERDYNIQTQRSQEDYLLQRQRAIRDFNKELSRQVQDQTKALYDPYHRIQTQAIWDAQSLLMNMREQNAAIGRQSSQLQQLRKMGVSTQALQQLDLNNPQNAQQLNQLVGDMLSNPNLAKQINATAAQRLSLGKLLVEDPTNKDITRARDDFNIQLKDMQVDYQKALHRAKSDFDRQMGDQVADFGKQMGRMSEDFQVSLDRSDTQYNVSAMRAARDFGIQMGQMDQDYQTQLKRMKEDVVHATKEITGGIDDLWKTLQSTMKGQNSAANKVMRDGLSETLTIIEDPKNRGKYRDAYKGLFPYDLSKLFAGGGGGPDAAHMPHFYGAGGPDAAHMPHGGPYAPYGNAAAQQFLFNHVGGMGTPVLPASSGPRVTQGYGEHRSGDPDTGGGWPVSGAIVSQQFGANPSSSNPGGHPGIDLAVGRGTPIAAALGGVVAYAGWNDGYGNAVIIDDGGGRSTLYGHQQAIKVRAGDKVKAGDLVGWVDSTGNSTGDHLHFETRINGQVVDPATYLPQWQASDGLGSFDPGATAAAYGVRAQFSGLDIKEYEKRSKKLGPWGSLLSLYEAELDGKKKMEESSSLTDVSGLKGLVPDSGQFKEEKDYAKAQLQRYGWGQDQFPALDTLWEHESGWNPYAQNSIGAYGIPQAYSHGHVYDLGDWKAQIDWGLNYIKQAYGSPAAAWAQWWKPDGTGSYRTGGLFGAGPRNITVGEGGPEAVIPLNGAGVATLAQAFGQAVSASQLSQMMQAGYGEKVIYHSETTHIDHSTHYDGDITVQAQDPMEMEKKLAARKRQQNLTRQLPPGTRR